MSNGHDLEAARREILILRARVVVLERLAMASLELALRIRPEESSLVKIGRQDEFFPRELRVSVDLPSPQWNFLGCGSTMMRMIFTNSSSVAALPEASRAERCRSR